MLGNDGCVTLAVVPVFVNAGAAVAPALIAGAATVVAALLRPRVLLPLVAVLAVGSAVWLLWPASPAGQRIADPRSVRASASAGATDWAEVALEIIRFEQRQQALTGVARPEDRQGPAPSDATEATSSRTDADYFRAGAARSGYVGGGSPVDLTLVWEQRADALTMYLASPLVQGNRVYAASTFVDLGKSYGSVLCVDATTGELLWETLDKAPDTPFRGFFSSPAVTADGRHVLIGQGLHLDEHQELVCLDGQTGSVKWLYDTPLHIESSPAIDGDIVVVGAGAIEGPDRRPESHPGFVFAVRISTGELLWKHDVNDPESSPAIVDGVAYIGSGFNGKQIVALRIAPDDALATQGLAREVWRIDTPHPAIGPITVAGDLVLAGGGNSDFVVAAADPEGFVIAVDRKTGEQRWQIELPDAVLGSIAVHDHVAVCTVRHGEVIALDLNNEGEILWRSRVHDEAPVLAGPAFTGSVVYAVSNDGYLTVIDATDGRVLERHYLNAPDKPGEMGLTTSAPFVAAGRLFVGSETGGLRCYAGKTVK